MWAHKDNSFEIVDRFGQEAYARQYYQNYLAHHGILGQKWGVRRFQNRDGTLTAEGRARYGVGDVAQGAKTLTTAYGRFNSRQKRTRIAARVGAKAAVVGSTVAGSVAGAYVGMPVGAPRQLGFVGGNLGLSFGRNATASIYKKAGQKLDKRRLEDNDVKSNKIVIEEGQEFKRTSLKEKEDGKDRLYVSPTLSDFDIGYYEQEWPKYLKKISGREDTKVYQNTYKTTMSLVAPSLDERKATAQAIVNTNKKTREEFAKAYAMDQMRLSSGLLNAKDINDLLRKHDSRRKEWANELADRDRANGVDKKTIAKSQKELRSSLEKERAGLLFNYNSMVDGMMRSDRIDMNSKNNFKKFTASIPTSPKLMNSYIKELKKQGYEAVYDDNSNGEAPFIIFDQKYLKQTGSRRIA